MFKPWGSSLLRVGVSEGFNDHQMGCHNFYLVYFAVILQNHDYKY